MKLRVEYYFDDDVRRWGFSIWALHIQGSGDTRAIAQTRAVEAVRFVLEGFDGDFANGDDVEVKQFDVIVADDPMPLRVEYRLDAAAGRWAFRVPALDVVGAAETRELAQESAIEAVESSLEGDANLFEYGDEIEVEYLDIDVRPATPAMTAGATG